MLTGTVHRRRSSVWRPTLDRDCTNSAVLVALQLNAERSSLKASKYTPSTKIDWAMELDAGQEHFHTVTPSPQTQNPYEADAFGFHFPPLQDQNGFNAFAPESDMEGSSEHTSPISDTTLFDDDLDMWPISLQTGAESMQRHMAINDISTSQRSHTNRQKDYEHVATLARRKGTRYSRHSFSGSVFDTLFKRKQLIISRDNAMMGVLTAEEREMEYKHRHTFIGTASLDDFLELLEISPSHRVTQSAVARAFIELASTEHSYARQYSTKPDGWGLVTRTTVGYKDIAIADYVVQSRVKLGTITLRQFLSMISFDQDNTAAVVKILDAFSAASYLDAKTNMDAENKARAFRSWIISQRSMQIAE